MKRRQFISNIVKTGAAVVARPYYPIENYNNLFTKEDFGKNFKWGVATAAYQIEGAWNRDGKGPSIWDTFTHKTRKIKDRSNGDVACDFYHLYKDDLSLVKSLNFDVFRFSFSWSRILPNGIGQVNQKGIEFYHRVIDQCLELGIEPWPTIYHWDLPQALEDKGGWKNREIISWFSEFTNVLTREYGSKVKNWMVINEGASFCAAGYLGGVHAPGKIAVNQFYDATHHANMCQAASGRIIRSEVGDANVGTTIGTMWVDPKNQKEKHLRAAEKLDAFINRLYLDPLVGRGYPVYAGKFFEKLVKRVPDSDYQKVTFDFDFIGVQNYSRAVAKAAMFPPFLWAFMIPPKKRDVPPSQITEMNWEVSPEGFYNILMQVNSYPEIKKTIVTENGAAFKDEVIDGKVDDPQRLDYYQRYLAQVLKAQKDGAKIDGYFAWSFMDNFEWAEGYRPRFGLVYVDYKTQKRIVKASGEWFRKFLED